MRTKTNPSAPEGLLSLTHSSSLFTPPYGLIALRMPRVEVVVVEEKNNGQAVGISTQSVDFLRMRDIFVPLEDPFCLRADDVAPVQRMDGEMQHTCT